MIIHTHPYPIELRHGGQARIIAFGDVHWGAAGCNKERFEEDVLAANADDPAALFLNMGDTFDSITHKDYRFRPHEVDPALVHEENIVDRQVETLAEVWNKYKIPRERCLGVAHGNHEDTILKYAGSNPTERFCYLTGQRNLGFTFALRVEFRVGTARLPLKILGCHGFAGGRKMGGAINAHSDHSDNFEDIDIFLYGHNHKKGSVRKPKTRVMFDHDKLKARSVIVGNTGTYLMTYSEGVAPSYAEKKGMYPVELGHLEILVRHRVEEYGEKGKRRKGAYLDLRCME